MSIRFLVIHQQPLCLPKVKLKKLLGKSGAAKSPGIQLNPHMQSDIGAAMLETAPSLVLNASSRSTGSGAIRRAGTVAYRGLSELGKPTSPINFRRLMNATSATKCAGSSTAETPLGNGTNLPSRGLSNEDNWRA